MDKDVFAQSNIIKVVQFPHLSARNMEIFLTETVYHLYQTLET